MKLTVIAAAPSMREPGRIHASTALVGAQVARAQQTTLVSVNFALIYRTLQRLNILG